MPLIRRDSETPAAGAPPDYPSLVDGLSSPDEGRRWASARGLADHAEAAQVLGEALANESALTVRQAIMTSLVRVGGEAGIVALLPFMRSEDAAMRGGALDALQVLPPNILQMHLPHLLTDPDRDVRILSCDLVRSLDPASATAILGTVLDDDPDPSVCGAAVDVLAEVGTRDAIPFLDRCAARFPHEQFLPFAIAIVRQRLAGLSV